MQAELCYTPATELARRIRTGDLSPVEVVDAYLNRIEEYNEQLNAFRVVFDERARTQAEQAEAEVESGRVKGPLHGVPVAIKDNADIAGESTSLGREPLLRTEAGHDSLVVKRLKEAGAILIGKTHMPELGFGTQDLNWGEPTSTPYDLERNSGGSSGGSAAAVAAGLTPLALGTDGGGSIRIPAAWCGVYGFKPSFRRTPRASTRPSNAFGSVMPFSEFCPMGRDVEDTLLMYNVMSGEHPRDPFTYPAEGAAYEDAVHQSIAEMDVAYSPRLDSFPVDPAVLDVVDEAVSELAETGVEVEETEIGIGYDHETITDIWMSWLDVAYAQQNEYLKDAGIDQLGEDRDDLHPELIEVIERGYERGAVEHSVTSEARTDLLNTFEDLFEQYDLLVTPTVAVPPVKNTEEYTVGPSEIDSEPVDPHLGWCLTHPFNFTGHPAASVPCGLTDAGLPVGMQLVGPRLADENVLAASAAVERIQPQFRPPIE